MQQCWLKIDTFTIIAPGLSTAEGPTMRQGYLPNELLLESEPDEEFLFSDRQQQSRIVQARIYEKELATFSQRLRRAIWLGMLLTFLTALLLLTCLPAISANIGATFFPFWLQKLNMGLSQYLHWLLSQEKWINYIDGVLLGSGVVLLVVTRNLRRGNEGQHWLAYAQIVGGFANLLLLFIPFVMYLPNLILWLLALLIALALIGLLMLILRALFF
jgi:hypothetical protein